MASRVILAIFASIAALSIATQRRDARSHGNSIAVARS
jgi:hypothetical protein